VTVTASVVADPPEAGTSTGLLIIQAGQNQLCQFTLNPSGSGSCSLTFPVSGLVPLEAVYPGQTPFLPGVSEAAILTVESPGWEEIVYQHNFETPVGAEWCLHDQEDTPSGRGFLGEFGNETACLSLDSLPPHQQVSVSFDLYVINSWNGNRESAGPWDLPVSPSEPDIIVGPDIWKVEADGQLLTLTTFSNRLGDPQAFPGQYPGQDYPRFSVAIEKNTLGYSTDSVYRLTYNFYHNLAALELDFTALGLQEMWNESWGLDNIIVRILIPATNSSEEE